MNKQNVDIIIPVYNAYEFTKKCIETVIENTDLKKNTLVVVNDKSPDKKITPMLNEFKKKNSKLNIEIIENSENCGFVKTVNIGMKHSKNDVVLLNSDTEVTKNWLDKMQKVAYVRENVATVTPLSNNATLASVPNFLEENELPSWITLEEYAKEIEECSFEIFPELTTAHGFCMYIRRDAIEKIGFFDEVTFEKGYGEENDFSYRCVNNGLVNLLCDNTFIYHKGTQSFSEDKKKLAENHWKILQEKYPDNVRKNTYLCEKNPYSFVQDNIKYYVNNRNRKNVLIVVHEFMKKEDKLIGGTVLHVYDLIDNLREKMNFHVLYPEKGKYRVKSFFENSTSEVVLGEISNYQDVMTHNYEYRKMVEKVFEFINIDFVHVHHLMYQYFDIIDLINEKKIPYIITLHDFYMVCPIFSLLENGEEYCGDKESPDCQKCLKKQKNIEIEFIDNWRKLSHDVLEKAKLVIAPTDSAREIVQKYFKDIEIKTIEHGMKKMVYEYEGKNENRKKNIAFLGGINKIKGIDFMREFVKEVNKEDNKYNLHLFGNTNDEKINESDGNYIYHGKYDREDVVKILKENEIDLVILLAIWPETYSYTLTESLMAKVPVLALDYGALAERIRKNNCGWILDRDSKFEDILKKVDEIFENEDEYKEKINGIEKYLQNMKSAKDMAKEYEEIYSEYLKQKNKMNKEIDKDLFLNMLRYSKEVIKNEEEIKKCYESMNEYHSMVMEYRKEINRLGGVIEDYKNMEQKYEHLISSRKLKLLKKIKFIEF